jgi:hypothetical protein
MNSYHFPFQVGDTDVRGFEDQTFECPVWRAGHTARGSSEIAAGGVLIEQSKTIVCNAAAFAIELTPLMQLRFTALSRLLLRCRACSVVRGPNLNRTPMSSASTLPQTACNTAGSAMSAPSSTPAANPSCSLSKLLARHLRSFQCRRRRRCSSCMLPAEATLFRYKSVPLLHCR